MFWCCSAQSAQCYRIDTKRDTKYTSSLSDIHPAFTGDPFNKITQIQHSNYKEIRASLQKSKSQFIDDEFPPDSSSLGRFDNKTQWKRISDIIAKPIFFEPGVQPKDVACCKQGNNYFLSAIAALSEDQRLIEDILGDQTYNSCGIYKVNMRVNGQIKEILVDDFVPVNSNDQPLFSRPFKNQFWTPIFEKAWAKVNGSYENMVAKTPEYVFEAFSFAPAESISTKDESLWERLTDHSKSNTPCCCSSSQEINPKNWGLPLGQVFTLIQAATFFDHKGAKHKVVKLRDPEGVVHWKGDARKLDNLFWGNIPSSPQKQAFLSATNSGTFCVLFPEFLSVFESVYLSNIEPRANYIYEQLFLNKKNGCLFQCTTSGDGFFTFEVNQQPKKDLSRMALLVIKCNQDKPVFLDGVMTYNQIYARLRVKLTAGKYLVYVKIDCSLVTKTFPFDCRLSVYGVHFASLRVTPQTKYPRFLEDSFLGYARQHERMRYNDEKMWLGCQALLEKGGYAYIAMGNQASSDKKFVIRFDQSDFHNMNFVLKKGFKGKGEGQLILVHPGEECIVLARVRNQQIDKILFPPRLEVTLQEL